MLLRERIVIGSRGSRLALWQANFVADQVRELVSAEVVIEKIKTRGDKIVDVPLAKVGGKGLFVKEIEVALLNERIDLAVHSMKDVPTDIPEGLVLEAVLRRDEAGDVLISREGKGLADLSSGATIGTSSLRRRAQLLNYRPDFNLVDVRGNLDTRLKKMEEGLFDGIVVAAAGLIRMGWTKRITERIPFNICLPAVGQGAIGVEIRTADEEIAGIAQRLSDSSTEAAVKAERALMRSLQGGCQVPIGALGLVEDGNLKLTAAVASLDGQRLIRDETYGSPSKAEEIGRQLAEKLLEQGATEILAEIRELTTSQR